MIRKEIFKDIFVFLLIITGLVFFSAKFDTTDTLKNFSYAYMLFAIIISLPHFFKYTGAFVFPIQLICVSILISFLMAYISWEQGFINSLSTIPYMIWFVFFYLLHIKYPVYKIENVIFFFGCLYILLFIFQFLNTDQVYFGEQDEFIKDRGVIRVNFPGAGVFYLAYLIALIRSKKGEKYRWFFILFIIAGVAVTILQVTRQSIALVLLITLFHYTKKASIPKRIALLSIFSLSLFFALNSDNSIAKGLLETQKETQASGDKYIRVLAGEYFLTDFSPNLASQIFGNGVPNYNSPLGQKTKGLMENRGFYLSDVGLIGFYVMFGILAIVGYIIIFIKSFRVKIPDKYYYLKYYVWYILATSLISDSVFSTKFLISNILVLYCFQRLLMIKKVMGSYSILKFIKSV